MSEPTEFDFALIKLGNGAEPEVFTVLCGLQDVAVNSSVESQSRYVPDCAKPGAVPNRKMRATGKSKTITGSGLTNKENVAKFEASLGLNLNYEIEGYERDGTDAGKLLGTWSGAFMMTAANQNMQSQGDSSSEVTLESHGVVTWTAAP